jgi:hypothetical protein
MLKVVIRGVLALLGVICVGAFWFLYSDDAVTATLTRVPEGGVEEAMYLERPDGGTLRYPLTTTLGLIANQVIISEGASQGGEGVFVKVPATALPIGNDDRTFAVLEGRDFHNGRIEVALNGSVSPNVSCLTRMFARGFTGICFRILADMERAECVYLRPISGRAGGTGFGWR